MSLLWRNHLRISLSADRLVLAAYSRGLRTARGRSIAVPVQPLPHAAEWRGALEALPSALGPFRGHDVSIVLADQFVRYVLLPWNEALRTPDQWMSLARHRLTAVHGAAAADWEVKLTDTAPGGPRLACAVDRALVADLAAQCAAARVQLVSVQPFLVTAFNRIRSAIGAGSCWLVIEEPGRLTLAFIQRGVWTAIRSRRADERWRDRLPELIEREGAFLALSEPCTRVIVCAQGRFDTEVYEAFRAQAVDYRDLALAWD